MQGSSVGDTYIIGSSRPSECASLSLGVCEEEIIQPVTAETVPPSPRYASEKINSPALLRCSWPRALAVPTSSVNSLP